MLAKRLRSGLLVAAACLLVGAVLLSPAVLPAPARQAIRTTVRRGELAAADLLLTTVGLDRPSGDQVVLAVVNQADLEYVAAATGQGWPWPREFWTALTRLLSDAGVAVIAFDLYFSEPSRYREDDRELGEAIAESGKVVLAAATSAVPPGHEEGAPSPAMPRPSADVARVSVRGPLADLPRRLRLVPPLAEVVHGAAGLGIAEVRPDLDTMVRRLAPAVLIGDDPVPTFATRIAMAYRRIPALGIANGWLEFGPWRLPLPRDGSLALRFRRPDPPRTPEAISFPTLHVANLMQAAFDHADGRPTTALDTAGLAGKIVIVGIDAPGIEDVANTPVSSTFLGSELHATAVDDFLRADFLDEWPRPGPYEHLPAALVATLIAVAATLPQSVPASVLAALGLAAAYLGLAAAMYRAGVLLPIFGPVVGGTLAFGSSTVYLYFAEGRKKREIGRMFSQYVAPAVVQELQRHPEKLRLGGERKVMTVFFSDIEGFTTVSESMEPEQLVAFLNDYLSRCTDLILDSGGVIDKYEGDAIIAFWNAPLDVPDHAARACEAAIRCQEACAAFGEACRQRGLPVIAMRVGINTGPMVVGNLGSSRRFDFTVIGDAVNLASRLEGANKVFGTYSMVSDATRTACADGIAFRELGRLRVKGKTVPITVHELVGRGRPAAWVGHFEEALRAFYAGRFEAAARGFEAVLGLRPADPPSRRYLEMVADLRQAPPGGPDFDGVLTLTSK